MNTRLHTIEEIRELLNETQLILKAYDMCHYCPLLNLIIDKTRRISNSLDALSISNPDDMEKLKRDTGNIINSLQERTASLVQQSPEKNSYNMSLTDSIIITELKKKNELCVQELEQLKNHNTQLRSLYFKTLALGIKLNKAIQGHNCNITIQELYKNAPDDYLEWNIWINNAYDKILYY